MAKRRDAPTVSFGFEPYPLQQEIIDTLYDSDYRFLVAILGRQSGKSWLARYVALDSAINRGKTVLWVSQTKDAARKHWNEIERLVSMSGLPVLRMARNDKEIRFIGGGSLNMGSAIEPDNMRGAAVDLLILDEAAFYRDGQYVYYNVCVPMITATRGKVLITTTPNGRNWVYQLYLRGKDKANDWYKSWRRSSLEAPYQDKELLAELQETMPSMVWREEYLAEFLADKGGVFAGLDTASVVEMLNEPLDGHRYCAGIDFGYSKDSTCFTVMDMDEREQVFGMEMTDVGTIPQILRLTRLMRTWQPEVTHIEKNGIGESLYDLFRMSLSGTDVADLDWDLSGFSSDFADKAKDTHISGGFRLKPLHMDHHMKVKLVERLAADIEYGGLKLLKNDEGYGKLQLEQMNIFERKRTPGGHVTYAAKKDEQDDTVSAAYVCYKGMPPRKKFSLKKPLEGRKNPFRAAGNGGRNLHARGSGIRSANRPKSKRLRASSGAREVR